MQKNTAAAYSASIKTKKQHKEANSLQAQKDAEKAAKNALKEKERAQKSG